LVRVRDLLAPRRDILFTNRARGLCNAISRLERVNLISLVGKMYRTLSYSREEGDYPDPTLITRWPVLVFANDIERLFYLEYCSLNKQVLEKQQPRNF
jgi:hypothetical protein